jgi:hypothetical protein
MEFFQRLAESQSQQVVEPHGNRFVVTKERVGLFCKDCKAFFPVDVINEVSPN